PGALAHVTVPGYGQTIASVTARAADGTKVPVKVKDGKVWPLAKLPAGEKITVRLTVKRPGWAGWLVGGTEVRTAVITTPVVHLRGQWLQVKPGTPVAVTFDAPVHVARIGAGRVERYPRAHAKVVVSSASHRAGRVKIAAAARSWEALPAPTTVTWFP